jgi:broad specificity phosphatase PhoE
VTILTLIRHGQAQTGAKDEKSYDNLSPHGHEQACWLGECLQQQAPVTRLISGTMKSQIQTAESLALPGVALECDPGLNELDYFGLAQSLHNAHGVPIPEQAATFAAHVPLVLQRWRNDQLDPALESYDAFRNRILKALRSAARPAAGNDAATDLSTAEHSATMPAGQLLLVTSTGVIATLAAIALGLDMAMKSKLFLRVENTSVHKFELKGDELHLLQFGATPHLDRPDRQYAKTLM